MNTDKVTYVSWKLDASKEWTSQVGEGICILWLLGNTSGLGSFLWQHISGNSFLKPSVWTKPSYESLATLWVRTLGTRNWVKVQVCSDALPNQHGQVQQEAVTCKGSIFCRVIGGNSSATVNWPITGENFLLDWATWV